MHERSGSLLQLRKPLNPTVPTVHQLALTCQCRGNDGKSIGLGGSVDAFSAPIAKPPSTQPSNPVVLGFILRNDRTNEG